MADSETRISGKEKVKQLTDRLADGVKELFASDRYAEYLRALPKMHKYSPRNALLIQMQHPGATLVAGYQAWQSKYGRYVKQGEHGIQILAPRPFTVKKEQQRIDPLTRRPVIGLDGLPETEVVEQRLARFRVEYVYDVSQTDGKPLPTLVEDLTGNVRHYEILLDALRAVSPMPIVFEPLPHDTDGICYFGDRIAIRAGMSEPQTVAAIIHEITHAKLHDKALQNENAPVKDKGTQEVEAESVAFAVCARYGIETAANSFPYVASWSAGRELKELNASLDVIHNTAAELMNGIDAAFQKLAKERGVNLSLAGDAPAAEPEQPHELVVLYGDRIAETVLNDPIYAEARANGDISVVRSASDAAIARAVTALMMESPENMPLVKEFIESPAFKEQLGLHVFTKTYLEAQAAEKDAVQETASESPEPAHGNTAAHRNYEKFAELFPQIASGEYRYLRLEAGPGMEPLSVQQIGSNQISVMHTYDINGDMAYDPDVVFALDRENGTLNAVSFEQSIPPLYQRVDENGDGASIDGNGNERTVRGLQGRINDFTEQWFGNIEQQGYLPVRAVQEIGGEDVEITFDAAGRPITPEPPKPEKDYDIGYGHMGNGLTVWNRAEEKDGDYVTVAHIGPDRAVTFYDKELPDDIKARIEDIALYSDARVSVTQQDRRVFETPPKEYELEYHDIPVYGTEVYNARQEQIAHILETGAVQYLSTGIPAAAKEKIEAVARERAGQREAEFLNGEGDGYAIYSFEALTGDSRVVKDNYRLAYFGPFEDGDTLDTIRDRFTADTQPYYEYHGRENGVPFGPGDIIVMKQDGQITPWYVDSLAFSEQKDFYGAPGAEAEKTTETLGGNTEQAAPAEAEAPDIDLMPDPAIGYSECDLFGFTDNDILPLTQYRAAELFDAGQTIYMLYPNGTEELVFETEEITKHDGIFGIERGEWLASPEYGRMKREKESGANSRESDLLYGAESSFGIYQLKRDAPNGYSWASMKELAADGLTVDRANYELVHTAPLTIRDTQTNLNKIFGDYNADPPEDFRGHSPSTSDVIVLQWRGEVSSHYVDSIGFAALPAFTGAEGKQRETVQDQPAAAYTSSQVGNTMDTAPKEPPQTAETETKPAETSHTANTAAPMPPIRGEGPTVAELTAQAEAGGQISVMALLAAIKREQAQAAPAKQAPIREAPGQHTERSIG